MWKTVLAGTTALAIAGATLAYAHPDAAGHERGQRWRPNAADIAAFADARIAALHAGLQLNAEQEKNWPAVAGALKDIAKQRADRLAARTSADKPKTPIARLERRAQAMTERGAALKKLAEAAGPLYDSLNPRSEASLRRAGAARRRVRARTRLARTARRAGARRLAAPPRPAWSRTRPAAAIGIDRKPPAASARSPRRARRRPGSRRDRPGGFSLSFRGLPRRPGGHAACQGPRPLLTDARLARFPPRQSGRIAQLVEQLTLNQRVQGSSPCAPTNNFRTNRPN